MKKQEVQDVVTVDIEPKKLTMKKANLKARSKKGIQLSWKGRA